MEKAELPRRIESLIRLGVIVAVDHAAARCRVQSGELTTDWLPWFAARAGTTRVWDPPTFDEQCVVFCPSGDPAAGFVLLGVFSDSNPAPSSSADEYLTVFPDGATVRYNHASGAMAIDGIKTMTISASESITLDAPQTTSTGKHTIKGLLSYLAGLAGIGGGAGTSITGPITHSGGDLSSNGIVLHTHRHPETQGITGGPQA